MLLRRLVLENIRSIKSLDLDFAAPDKEREIRKWTLLLGQNGTGKSTVLKSVGLLLAGSEGLAGMQLQVDEWIRKGEDRGVIRGVLQTQEGECHEIALEFRRGMSAFEVAKNQDLGRLDAALKHTPRNYFAAGYGASRRLPPTDGASLGKSRSPGSRVSALESLFNPNATLHSLEDWAIDLDYRRGEEGLAMIREALKGLLPGMSVLDSGKDRKQLRFKTPDGLVPISGLSDGYQNMAAWCGDLLYRITSTFGDYKDPLKTRGLLLIDEIDLHLHPVWQRRLISFLNKKLPNFQIIATTHSPLTAQQAGRQELHLLDRKSPRSAPQLRRFDGEPRKMRIEELVVSPWFGLESGYSLEVEKDKNEYLELRGKTTGEAAAAKPVRANAAAVRAAAAKKGKDKGRLAALASKLAAVTTSVPQSPLELQNQQVLQKLDAVLDKISKSKAR